jgi:hypothetical protein
VTAPPEEEEDGDLLEELLQAERAIAADRPTAAAAVTRRFIAGAFHQDVRN